ncbi:MAG: sigma-70 family RNA polymerase sigma factor, partial [Clostridiales bacterium]|nr:sigma-70 family RNA polymerase sigma factor [Clostridiales bacterium]
MKPFYPDNLSDAMSDENLVLLTLSGDPSAYDRLVLRWETAVVHAALAVCRNRELARDAAQDAFVTAWIKLANLADGAKYGAWTCKIARNCALQLLTRYRYYTGEISTDDENAAYAIEDPYAVDPAQSSVRKAEWERMHTAIDNLPERVRLIIRLYYLENHSIEEIATLLGVTSGTVKKQLWDGRRKIRKELCAMDETMQDTLLERVHKKVEEVKAWQYLDKKEGFATVYHDALAMIEELPESGEKITKGKYHAMADVLLCGWWWLPGEQSDALFARIREAAFAGGNEDVIAAVMENEREKLWGNARWNYIKEVQIPELEKAGYNRALAQTYFWLGVDMVFDDTADAVKAEGRTALEKTVTLSGLDDPFHAHAKAALDVAKSWEEKYKDESIKAYRITAGIMELCLRDGVWRMWRENWSEKGWLNSVSIDADCLLHNMASGCDHYLTKPDLAVGETWYSSTDTRLTHVSDSETVETPCGTFAGCSLWEKENRTARVRTWLRDGVGIVRQDYTVAGFTDTRLLSEYHLYGGTGLLPLAAGNRWSYDGGYNPEMLCHFCTYTVAYADTERANVTMRREYHRLGYDTNDFYDTMAKARNAYCDYNQGAGYQVDQSETMRRAEELAKTPFEIAYAASANDVLRRIQSCRNGLPENKNNVALPVGRWNFFDFVSLYKDKGKTRMNRDFRRSFEWKSDREGPGEALLMNSIMELLSNADDNCVWDEEWETPGSRTRKYLRWGDPVCAKITTEDIGEYTVRAGTFADCKRLTVTMTGFQLGYGYANGTRTYILAPGIGILSVTNP